MCINANSHWRIWKNEQVIWAKVVGLSVVILSLSFRFQKKGEEIWYILMLDCWQNLYYQLQIYLHNYWNSVDLNKSLFSLVLHYCFVISNHLPLSLIFSAFFQPFFNYNSHRHLNSIISPNLPFCLFERGKFGTFFEVVSWSTFQYMFIKRVH